MRLPPLHSPMTVIAAETRLEPQQEFDWSVGEAQKLPQ